MHCTVMQVFDKMTVLVTFLNELIVFLLDSFVVTSWWHKHPIMIDRTLKNICTNAPFTSAVKLLTKPDSFAAIQSMPWHCFLMSSDKVKSELFVCVTYKHHRSFIQKKMFDTESKAYYVYYSFDLDNHYLCILFTKTCASANKNIFLTLI